MDNILGGEKFRRSVRWISEERVLNPGKNILKIVEEAVFQFDLNPQEDVYLRKIMREQEEKTGEV